MRKAVSHRRMLTTLVVSTFLLEDPAKAKRFSKAAADTAVQVMMTGRCFGEHHSVGTIHGGKNGRRLPSKVQHSELEAHSLGQQQLLGPPADFNTASLLLPFRH